MGFLPLSLEKPTDRARRGHTLAILCGGKSSRFGQDKGLFRSSSSEPSLWIRNVLLWTRPFPGVHFTEVLVLVKNTSQQAIYQQDWERFLDQEPFALPVRIQIDSYCNEHAPIFGVLSALQQAEGYFVTVAAVDQLQLRSVHFASLHKLCESKNSSPFSAAAGFYQGVSSMRLISEDEKDGKDSCAPTGSDGSCTRSTATSARGGKPSPYRLLKPQGNFTEDTPQESSDSFLPFPSLWSPLGQAQLEANVGASQWSVHEAMRDMNAHRVPISGFERELLYNANTLDTYKQHMGTPLLDPYERRLTYLRFSLTERCNMACSYCLPDGNQALFKQQNVASLSTIETVLGGFRQLGFQKVRFTGGEPTLHPHCKTAIEMARKLGYEHIAITTNGLAIKELRPFLDAGLTQLTVSMDSLHADTFERITKSKCLGTVLRLVDQAIQANLQTKINTVLLQSQNRNEADTLIDWALERPLTLRFIELMPTGLNQSFDQAERVLGSDLEPLLRQRGLVPEGKRAHLTSSGPEVTWTSKTKPGKIGLINPLSCNFCSQCNRLRVTSQGRLQLCLFGEQHYELPLSSKEELATAVRNHISQKPERHYLEQRRFGNTKTFRIIGG